MTGNSYFLMTFTNTNDSMQTFQMAEKKFKVVIMPTPCEITRSCGLAIKFLEWNRQEILDFYNILTVPCSLYCQSVSLKEKTKTIELIAPK